MNGERFLFPSIALVSATLEGWETADETDPPPTHPQSAAGKRRIFTSSSTSTPVLSQNRISGGLCSSGLIIKALLHSHLEPSRSCLSVYIIYIYMYVYILCRLEISPAMKGVRGSVLRSTYCFEISSAMKTEIAVFILDEVHCALQIRVLWLMGCVIYI